MHQEIYYLITTQLFWLINTRPFSSFASAAWNVFRGQNIETDKHICECVYGCMLIQIYIRPEAYGGARHISTSSRHLWSICPSYDFLGGRMGVPYRVLRVTCPPVLVSWCMIWCKGLFLPCGKTSNIRTLKTCSLVLMHLLIPWSRDPIPDAKPVHLLTTRLLICVRHSVTSIPLLQVCTNWARSPIRPQVTESWSWSKNPLGNWKKKKNTNYKK